MWSQLLSWCANIESNSALPFTQKPANGAIWLILGLSLKPICRILYRHRLPQTTAKLQLHFNDFQLHYFSHTNNNVHLCSARPWCWKDQFCLQQLFASLLVSILKPVPASIHVLNGYSWVTQVQFYKFNTNKNMGQNISLWHRWDPRYCSQKALELDCLGTYCQKYQEFIRK